ncbi:MAG: hypothetical protein CME70_06195 [Halobacteriovorax sp.]|nr:hypothetical protein [Halobacteriovorax sp.]|tara:strand:- start:303 stop:842 length:540 start_codon:yes stop_codon:yes gene_type:complete
MPSAGQNTVDTRPGADGGLGPISGISRSNKASLTACFPNTPKWITSDNGRKDLLVNFQKLVIDGAPQGPGALAHWGMADYSREFAAHASNFNYGDVNTAFKTGGNSDPGSPWGPNVAASAPAGSPWDAMSSPPAWMEKAVPSASTPGSGEGAVLSPARSSAKIDTFTVNDYILGSSPTG